MRSLLFDEYAEVKCVPVLGSQAVIDSGTGSTARSPGNCNPGWFVGESTVILGANSRGNELTVARWQVALEPSLIDACEAGRLVICCERTHGGLHTRRKGALASVLINGHNRDLVALKDVPAGHTDFFHRPPNSPQLPHVWPLSGCATVYSWPVDGRHLVTSGLQEVRVEVEKDVSWDIDYVCIVVSRRTRQLRDACKQVIYILLGVVLGAVATLLVS